MPRARERTVVPDMLCARKDGDYHSRHAPPRDCGRAGRCQLPTCPRPGKELPLPTYSALGRMVREEDYNSRHALHRSPERGPQLPTCPARKTRPRQYSQGSWSGGETAAPAHAQCETPACTKLTRRNYFDRKNSKRPEPQPRPSSQKPLDRSPSRSLGTYTAISSTGGKILVGHPWSQPQPSPLAP